MARLTDGTLLVKMIWTNNKTRLSAGSVFVMQSGLFAEHRWPAFEGFVISRFPVRVFGLDADEGTTSNPR